MIYYTIFVKGLNNSTGYIDVALSDDQLLKDFLQYLDVGIKPHRSYGVTSPPKLKANRLSPPVSSWSLSDVTAITAMRASQ